MVAARFGYLTTRYPSDGGTAAVNEPFIWAALKGVNTRPVGCAVGATQGAGGVKVYSLPLSGSINVVAGIREVLVLLEVATAHVPAETSAVTCAAKVDVPLIPTCGCGDCASVLAATVKEPYLISITLEVSYNQICTFDRSGTSVVLNSVKFFHSILQICDPAIPEVKKLIALPAEVRSPL